MKGFIFGKKGVALLLAVLATFVFAGAALADDADNFLSNYEKFVVKTEELAKQDSISAEQANDFLKSYQEFIAEAQKSAQSGVAPSEAQQERLTDLSKRLQAAGAAIQSKQK